MGPERTIFDIRQPPERQLKMTQFDFRDPDGKTTTAEKWLAGGRTLIPKGAFGWPILAGFAPPPRPAALAG
jgi:hypothetical protein